MAAKTYRPEELATEIGVSGKLIRAFLRTKYTRKAEKKNSAWVLDAAMAKAVRDHFAGNKGKAKDEAKPKADPKPKAEVKA